MTAPFGICPQCPTPLRRGQLKYCSRECSSNAQRKKRGPCQTCGKPLVGKQTLACSRACAGAINCNYPPAHQPDVRKAVADKWCAGIPVRTICSELRLSKNQVIGLAHRMGLPRHASTPGTAAAVPAHPKPAVELFRPGAIAADSRERWTPEKEAEFDADWLAGMTSPDMARKYNRSVDAIWAKRGQRRLPPRPSGGKLTEATPEMIERVRAALAAGMAQAHAAKSLCMTLGEFKSIANRNNAWPKPLERVVPPEKERMRYGQDPLPAGHPVSWEAIRVGSQAPLP